MKKYNSLFVVICIIISSVGCKKLGCRKRMDNVQLNPIFQNFQPEEQVFEILPKKSNEVLGSRCTRLIIPPEAFELEYDLLLDEEKITIKLTEYLDTLDMASSGVRLHYINDQGDEELFESAGMLRVKAEFNRKPLSLKKDRFIKVQFPSLARGNKFNLYKLNSKGLWEYHGYNEESYAMADGLQLQCVRLYEIPQLGYWNFAYPRKDSSLIRGVVQLENVNDQNQVFVLGLNTKGYWQKWLDQEKFIASFYQRSKVRVVVVAPDGRIGVSKIFNSGNRYGHKKYPEGPHNYVKDIGEIEFKNVSSSILNDKLKFMMYLGIEI